MGIPSYYKKLADKVKGLVTKSRPDKPSSLFFDFNCLIYHCARRPNTKLPPYPGEDRKEEWESLLVDDIAKYVQHIWHEAGQPPKVFLSIDGVVPMAKIKQQRLRRFKSIWLQANEPSTEPRWDTNCITPGTEFMRRLSNRLLTLCKSHKDWTLSDDLEPGEGEHKIMNILRQSSELEGPVLVYGLDADLILLTLLNAPKNTYLMREDSEMGLVNINQFGEESFSYFSLEALSRSIWTDKDATYEDIVEYVTAMSFLGNDFLPHSLSIKIGDDGHSFLLRELGALHQSGQHLVLLDQETTLLKLNYDAVGWLLERWSLIEADRLLHNFKKKIQMRGQVELNNETLPLENPVEFRLVQCENKMWSLKQGWEDVYRKDWTFCSTPQETTKCCEEYFVGLQWVLDYYTGQRVVNRTWFYPRLIPPLWRDLAHHLKFNEIPEPPLETDKPIQPDEQLAMVLPVQSWHHLPKTSLYRSAPSFLPQFWPERFGFFTAGRIRTWECEPLLPVLSLVTLRKTCQKQTLH
jgi:5'-3' exonuclease